MSRRPETAVVTVEAFAAALDRIAVLEDRLVALEGRRRAIDAAHRMALRALAVSANGHAFTTQLMITRAHTVDRDLHAALQAAGLGTARQLGRWLRTIRGRVVDGIDGMWIEAIGRDEDGVVWIIRLTEPR